MSQAKVDKYKEYKANRKEILAKEKRKKKIEKITGWAIGIVIIAAIGAGIGLTAYNSYEKQLAARPNYERDYKIFSDMTGILNADETAE